MTQETVDGTGSGFRNVAAKAGARVKVGSDEHRELFCRTFIETHVAYEPEELPWPELDDAALAKLRAVPIWSMALQIELNAGEMVTDFAASLSDPLIRSAVALQGAEERRHGRMIRTLVDRYGLTCRTGPPELAPSEHAFLVFGYGECLDSFLGFGVFRLARERRFLPESLMSLFSRVLAEEARHIVFFANWIAYERVRRGYGFAPLQALFTARGYFEPLVERFRSRDAATGPGVFTDGDAFADLTMSKFLAACLAENEVQMAALDPRLIRPRVMPRLAALALDATRVGEGLGAAVRALRLRRDERA